MDRITEYSEWIHFADDDIETARLLNNQHRKSLHIICFHCQQAAEKYLKAFLVCHGIVFEKTHDLVYLNRLCESVNPAFTDLMRDCLKLNPYAVVARYPSQLELIESDSMSALKAADFIKMTVLSLLK